MTHPELKYEITTKVETTGKIRELSKFEEGDFFLTLDDQVFQMYTKTRLRLEENCTFLNNIIDSENPSHCDAYCLNDGKTYSMPLNLIGYPVKVKISVKNKTKKI